MIILKHGGDNGRPAGSGRERAGLKQVARGLVFGDTERPKQRWKLFRGSIS